MGCGASLSTTANRFGQIGPRGHTALVASVNDARQQRQCTAALFAAGAKATSVAVHLGDTLATVTRTTYHLILPAECTCPSAPERIDLQS